MRNTRLAALLAAAMLIGACGGASGDPSGVAGASGGGNPSGGAGGSLGVAGTVEKGGSGGGVAGSPGAAGASGVAGSSGVAGVAGGASGSAGGTGDGGSGGAAPAGGSSGGGVSAGGSGGRGGSGGASGRGGATSTGGSSGLGKWETLAPMVGTRQEFGVSAIGGLVYSVGAFGSGAASQRLDAYDPKTNQWTARATIPFPADHPNTTGANGKIYILGETGDTKSAVYDPATNTWTMCKPIPTQRAAAGIAAIGTKIYVAGGATGNNGAVFGPSVRDFAAYDIPSDTWETLPQIPEPVRNHMVGAAWDGIFYIVGGRTNGPTDGLQSRVDAYDPVAKTWAQKAPMPRARGGIAGGVINGVIIIVGGEGNAATVNPNRVFPDTDAYDIATNTWRTLAPMLTPRHGMGAGVVDGKLYVPGGATAQGGGTAVAILEAFTPP